MPCIRLPFFIPAAKLQPGSTHRGHMCQAPCKCRGQNNEPCNCLPSGGLQSSGKQINKKKKKNPHGCKLNNTIRCSRLEQATADKKSQGIWHQKMHLFKVGEPAGPELWLELSGSHLSHCLVPLPILFFSVWGLLELTMVIHMSQISQPQRASIIVKNIFLCVGLVLRAIKK